MTDFKCKKCHRPLASGKKCDACKQQGRDKVKSHFKNVVKVAGGAAGLLVLVLPFLNKEKE